jgi:UDP-N-acetylmuramate dehydrogenase
MMELYPSISLKNLNTFGIDVRGNVAIVKEAADVARIANATSESPSLILGGGSNLLFTQNPEGWIWKNELLGINCINESDEFVWVKAGAGENWHRFVLHCIENNWGGIENLSLIPGLVGASPMQNIGAYGVEIKDVFHSLEAIDLQSGSLQTFDLNECAFGYRESVFKHALKGKYLISSVTYCLRKKKHELKLDYGDIKKELEIQGIVKPGIADVSRAVIAIRSSKLPDPKILGNAGSFFKNPVVAEAVEEKIRERYPEMVAYPAGPGFKKLAAGWLIEKAGWKGFRRGDAGVHAKQALVLVNYGTATGSEIWQLSEDIVNHVEDTFGVRLEREVNIL